MSDFKSYLNCYEFDVTLPGSGDSLKIKPIVTGQLKKLLVHENDDNPMLVDTILDELMTESVVTEGFDINSLSLQDRFYLLLELRKISKGKLYKFQMVCDKCQSQSLHAIDLDALKVTKLNDKVNYDIKLDDNLTITMSYLTRGAQKEAFKRVKKTDTTTMQMADMSTLSFASAIKSVTLPDGSNDISLDDGIYIVDNMTQGMYDSLTQWVHDNNYGVEFKTELVCSSCGNKRELEIPLENFFF
jgi:hypothetical protein